MKRYNIDQIKYIKDNYATVSNPEIAKYIGVTITAICAFAKRYKLKKNLDIRYGQANVLSPEQLTRLKEIYADTRNEVIAAEMRLKVNTIQNQAHRYQLKKSVEYMKNESHRYGAKQPIIAMPKGYHAPGSEKGWFKKGRLPHNTLYDGAIKLRAKKGKNEMYLYIRLSCANWEMLHKVVWVKQYGQITPGYCIRFKDGNSLNCQIENLEMVSRAEHLTKNHTPEQKREASSKLTDKFVYRTLKMNTSIKELIPTFDNALSQGIIEAQRQILILKRLKQKI